MRLAYLSRCLLCLRRSFSVRTSSQRPRGLKAQRGPKGRMLGLRAVVELPFVSTSGEVSRGEKMALRGTDPGLYITEYTLVYEDKIVPGSSRWTVSRSYRWLLSVKRFRGGLVFKAHRLVYHSTLGLRAIKKKRKKKKWATQH